MSSDVRLVSARTQYQQARRRYNMSCVRCKSGVMFLPRLTFILSVTTLISVIYVTSVSGTETMLEICGRCPVQCSCNLDSLSMLTTSCVVRCNGAGLLHLPHVDDLPPLDTITSLYVTSQVITLNFMFYL